MNPYLRSEIRSMQIMLKNFERAVEMAALQDDGKLDAKEIRQIRRIKTATKRYSRELAKI